MISYSITPEQMKTMLLEIADKISPKCKDFIIDFNNEDIIKLYIIIRYALINTVVEIYGETL